MIGIDSNILVRFLLDDDPVWSPRATKFIEEELSRENQGYVNIAVLVETIWSLRKSPLFERAKLATVVEGLLLFEKLVLAEREAVERALARYRAGGAGFTDYLIAELNRAVGIERTVTIDKRASSKEAFHRLT